MNIVITAESIFMLTFRHKCRIIIYDTYVGKRGGEIMNKRGQETRRHIKKSACSLFAEKGFKDVTMKDICEAAKLSRGGLYCHYESTRQIFQEMIEDMTDRQEDMIDSKIKQNQSAITILDELLDVYEHEMMDSQASLDRKSVV